MKKILTNNFGLKALSLLFAILLWLIVLNVDDPKVTRKIQGIPVTVLDESVITDNNQVYRIISGKEVTISVTGPRSMVDKMTRDYFVAEAPFSEKSNVDAVPIYVSFRNSKYDKECEISQKTMSMKLDIEQVVEKTFDININHTSELSGAYYLGKESISPSTVTVNAPESIINQIGKVQIDIDLSSKTGDFSTESNIKFCGEGGNEIKLGKDTSISSTASTYSATIYQVREIPLKVGYVGTVSDGYELVDVTADVATVKVAGPASSQLESIDIPNELVNVSGATENVSATVDISALLPEGVYLCNESDTSVVITADIQKFVSKTYTIPASAIDKNNIPDGYVAEIVDNNVNIVLTGLQKAHDGFNVNNIEAYVDLKNTVEGVNQVMLRFTLPDGLKSSNVTQLTVNMKLIEEQQTSTNNSEESTNNTEQ